MKLKRALLVVIGVVATLFPGVSTASADDTYQPYIVDGYYAGHTNGAVQQFRNGQAWCTASLISAYWVLTAQHCVTASASYGYRVGSTDAYAGTWANASAIYQHPSADLALVRLSNPVSGPIVRLGSTSPGQYAQIYGWGSTCASDGCPSRWLKYANTIVSSTNARDGRGGVAIALSRYDGITAGGDSGGPAFANGTNIQVGVASTSDRANYASYTSVAYYRGWIRSVSGV
ncbi:S1 family peptidase [Amycolatopsis pittospori]|uniref:S1 family peptidase n=1 Tax=Amycolatopsis pittospori TaxID=2749434 RepID=UPI0015F03D47|nr:trypsin-like serine protease [Amycolatopsis pittospori]